MKGWKIGAAAGLLGLALQVHAEGDCERRPLTATEKKWVGDAAAAVKSALPPAPAGWVGIDPADVGLTYSNTRLATTPADTCATGGPYALQVEASAYFTPKNSALAQRAGIGRKRAALTRQQSQLSRSIGAASSAGGSEISGNASDMMALQQEIIAAQASGDGVRLQRAMEKMQKAGDAMTESSQQMSDQGTANYERSARLQQQDQELASQFDGLAGTAAQAALVMVTASINPQTLRARPKAARSLEVPGAAYSWIQTEVQICFGETCTDKSASAVALFGKLAQDFDNGEAVSYQAEGAVRAAAAQRSAMIVVEGTPSDVERVFKSAHFSAMTR